MARLRSPWTQASLVWTAVLAVVAVILCVVTVVGFLDAADACYFQSGPCSTDGDANFVTLRVAVFVVPAVWLAGVLVGIVARAIHRRR